MADDYELTAGDGAALTPDAITKSVSVATNNVPDSALSTNVALKDATNVFTAGQNIPAVSMDGGTTYSWSQDSKPSVRPASIGGGALVGGDCYFDTVDRFTYVYDATSTKWLSEQVQQLPEVTLAAFTVDGTLVIHELPLAATHDLYIVSLSGHLFIETTNAAGNCWNLSAKTVATDFGEAAVGTPYSTAPLTPSTYYVFNAVVNTFIDCGVAHPPMMLLYTWAKTGSPGAIYGGMVMSFRWAKR